MLSWSNYKILEFCRSLSLNKARVTEQTSSKKRLFQGYVKNDLCF